MNAQLLKKQEMPYAVARGQFATGYDPVHPEYPAFEERQEICVEIRAQLAKAYRS